MRRPLWTKGTEAPLRGRRIHVHNVHIMRTVNVAELRSHLSSYLARVRGGEEILVRDHSLAVAKIVPISKTENYGEELLELAALGTSDCRRRASI